MLSFSHKTMLLFEFFVLPDKNLYFAISLISL
jgi:hypothetical protein